MDRENLGAAERLIQALLAYSDHMYHNRPGIVTPAPGSVTGVLWQPAVCKVDTVNDVATTNVYRLDKRGGGAVAAAPKGKGKGKKGPKTVTIKTLVGGYNLDGTVRGPDGRKLAEFRYPGIFPEVAVWAYQQVAEVWKLDNEFAARWASYAFGDKQTSRDLKAVLAAFMLCQSRKGEPVFENGKIVFHDEDYRDVGEAMALLPNGFDLKLLLRLREVLELEGVAKINRELGFGRSARERPLGRWPKVAAKWLRFREQNPKVLDGLIKAGFQRSVRKLVKGIGYKPAGPDFYKKLRWNQAQASDGRRALAIGEKVDAAETWAGLSEAEICERIVKDKPSFKRIVGMLQDGLTRAVVMAAIESGSLSDKDLIIFAPTLEELGLHKVQEVQDRLAKALRNAEDQRAANIARNVQSKEVKEALQAGADNAVKAAVAEVVKGIRVYFMIDISQSMQGAIEEAKRHIEKFLGGFPQDQLHICVFNTSGREITLKHASAAGVSQAFRGITAGGGTDYGAGIRALQGHKPKADEDVLFIFVGDEGHNGAGGGHGGSDFVKSVQDSGLNPMAIGLVPVVSPQYGRANCVRETAAKVGIPCFEIGAATFEDPYAIPRTLRALVAATPVGRTAAVAPVRVTLVDTIMKTPLLKKPVWADAVMA